jgi:hypothetical protein
VQLRPSRQAHRVTSEQVDNLLDRLPADDAVRMSRRLLWVHMARQLIIAAVPTAVVAQQLVTRI